MKILFLDAYFEPEQIAFTHLERDLLEKLVEEGNDIHIICPTPTRGISTEIAMQYKSRKTEKLLNGHVNVTRFSAPQESNNPLIRAFRYFWCNWRTYQLGKRRTDCGFVFCNSTPPTQGWIAGKVARKIKAPFIYSLQDVFPDSLVTTGLTERGSFLWKMGRILENKTYSYCDRIIVITEAMRRNLLEKGVEEKKVVLISNWIDTDKIKPIDRKNNNLFDEFDLDRTKFTVVYAGNFGEAQGADIVLNVAEKLKTESDMQFVIFGSGSGFEDACKKAKGMENVFIHPLMPQDRVAEVYSMGDVALITAKKGVGKSGMPSKTWSIMACNVPVIASFDKDSELAEVINVSHAGICIEPENAEQMAISILEIKEGKKSFVSGRIYIQENVSKDYCVEKYFQLMKNTKRTKV